MAHIFMPRRDLSDFPICFFILIGFYLGVFTCFWAHQKRIQLVQLPFFGQFLLLVCRTNRTFRSNEALNWKATH